jgi:hypothetical protein
MEQKTQLMCQIDVKKFHRRLFYLQLSHQCCQAQIQFYQRFIWSCQLRINLHLFANGTELHTYCPVGKKDPEK